MNSIQIKPTRLLALVAPGLLFGTPAIMLPTTGFAGLEEMVVTTRRREENIQDIPVAVAAFGADFIDKQGIVSTADVVKLVPGVQFDQSFSAADTRISIRGINNTRGRASVAILVDGIDVSGENITAGGGSSLLNTHLLDLERIEVIKGPQSALYGRNAFAGAISFVTKKPNLEKLDAKVSADVANYNTVNVRGSVSGPVIKDKLALGINAATRNTDGYYNNTVDGSNLNGAESNGARGALLWTPTENFDLNATLTYAKEESDPRAVAKVGNANQFYLGQTPLPPGTQPQFSAFGTQSYGQWLGVVGSVPESDVALSTTGTGASFKGSEDERVWGTVTIGWDIGRFTFKSLSSYLDNEASLQEDADFQDGLGTPFMGVNLSVANDYQDQTDTRQISQEFLLQSNSWDRGSWLVGVQGYQEDVTNTDSSLGWYNDPNTAFIPDFCIGNGFGIISCSYADSLAAGVPPKITDRDTTSYSAFGMVAYDFTEKFTLTAELRYIHDEIEVSTNTLIDRVSQYLLNIPIDLDFGGGPAAPLPATDKQTTDDFNPRLAVDYKFSDSKMIYASVAKGTKPGGFGTAQFAIPQEARMDPETLWAYELGGKTQWFDGALQGNAAVFFNDYTDRQVGVTVTSPITGWPSAGIVNAAAAETKGIEFDVMWMPLDILTFGVGYAYTDAEWTDFNYSTIRPGGATAKDQAICGNAAGDCSGAAIAGIPENAVTLLANVTRPIGGGDMDWFINSTGLWQDKRAVQDRVNTPYIDAFWNFAAQAGVETEKWNVMIYAENLLNEDASQWGQGYQDFRDGMYGGANGGEPRDESVMAFLPNPRIIGLRAGWKF